MNQIKIQFHVHMNRLSTKGLLFSYIIEVKNGPSVLNTWHPRLADKPRKLCVHYTSSPALTQNGRLSLSFLRTHIPIWRGEGDV